VRFIAIGIPLNLIMKKKGRDKDISHMKEVTGFLGVYSCRDILYIQPLFLSIKLFIFLQCVVIKNHTLSVIENLIQILQFKDDSKVGFNV